MALERYSEQKDILVTSRSLSTTRREVAGSVNARSHELLLRGGFIHQEAAGIYSLLPLGLRAVRNIEAIVRREMTALGAQEVLMPILHPKQNWEKTNRWNNFDVLFKTQSNSGSTEYGLGPTAEEMAVPLIKDFVKSYRDLPVMIFQIQDKFRDEARARSGILRGREFGMADMYSFHADEESLVDYYKKVKLAYFRMFEKFNVPVRATEASGGTFTAGQTEEFMVISELGEDTIITCDNCFFTQNIEVSTHNEGDVCPQCSQSNLAKTSSIEAGHIFNLGDKFTKDFDLKFTDKEGQTKFPLMGCYGVGLTRLLGTIVEKNNDDKGIVWPRAISPFDLHIVVINANDTNTIGYAEKVKNILRDSGMSIYFDDRNGVTAGAKFAEADLIGIPTQVVVSPRLMGQNSIEVRSRASGQTKIIGLDNDVPQLDFPH